MFDAGVATQTFCLAAYEYGVGTVIMGIFDAEKVAELLHIPENEVVVALVPIGYPDESPVAPRRKSVEDLLTFCE
jgi:nitroreductase